jgi:murein DD-endopeptidase MepM/ murein hydrolase activator NlpD
MNVQFSSMNKRHLIVVLATVFGLSYNVWAYSARETLEEQNTQLKFEHQQAVSEAQDVQIQMEEIAIRLLRMEFTMRSLGERGHSLDQRTKRKVASVMQQASMDLSSGESLLRLVSSRHSAVPANNVQKGVLGAYTRMLDATNFLHQGIVSYTQRMETLETAVTKRIGFLDLLPSTPPVKGQVTSHFGVRDNPLESTKRKKHLGIDVRGEIGTPIRAPADGVVKSAHKYGSYGNYISINHGDDFATRFAHLDDIRVKRGDKIVRGQIIGTLGNTGKSTGPHLHYEVLYQDRNIDPSLITTIGRQSSEQMASH